MRFYGQLHPLSARYGEFPVPLKRFQALTPAEAAEGYAALSDPDTIRTQGKTEKPYPSAVCYYRPAFLRPYYDALTAQVREMLDYDIVETYWYARLYGMGDQLKIHADRGPCFVSVSLCFGYAHNNMFPDGARWPIGALADHGTDREREVLFDLAPGEAMLYPGCGVPHWREMFLGDRCGQAFFHWVPADDGIFGEFYGDPEFSGG